MNGREGARQRAADDTTAVTFFFAIIFSGSIKEGRKAHSLGPLGALPPSLTRDRSVWRTSRRTHSITRALALPPSLATSLALAPALALALGPSVLDL